MYAAFETGLVETQKQQLVHGEMFFSAVQPDPPFELNWTLLNQSVTCIFYDLMLSWRPPQSAEVELGWMTLQYEVQYRNVNSDLWEVVGSSYNLEKKCCIRKYEN